MKKLIVPVVYGCLLVFGCTSHAPAPIQPVRNNEPRSPAIVRQNIKMIKVESGNLTTGNQTRVNSFYLGAYPVTQKEYQAIIGSNPSFFKGENLPVENVSWIEAVEFCNFLSQREGLTPVYTRDGNNITWNRNANGYRLPTENEWEYACRAGTSTPFNTGFSISTSQANYDGRFPYNSNTRGEYRARTTPVGTFAANQWGLYDMHGNVWEWCWDDPNGRIDSSELSTNTVRVIRGGAWSSSGISLHSAYRSGFQPFWKNNYIGFRLARNAE